MDLQQLVDYAASLDCIHCGLCLRTCPTYQLTGREASSPRGRIYMMRAVAEGELDASDPDYGEELDFCLVCRHCESACPAGVRFGEMMEHARDGRARLTPPALPERAARWIGFGRVLPSRALLRIAFGGLRLLQRTGLLRLVAKLGGERGRALAGFPGIPPAGERRLLPRHTPPEGTARGEVAVLEGCVMPELYGRVNRATVRVLAAAGHGCHTAPGHACCGALHAHNGELEGARALARETIQRFEAVPQGPEGPLPIVVNSAGCGAHMKDYARLLADDAAWSERAARLAARVRDLSEVLAADGDAAVGTRPVQLPGSVAYDDPCHLCHGQGVRSQPRELLDRVRGLERVELSESESCCGSAGIYSLLRPGDSNAVFETKRASLERSGARVLVTANPGCQQQWESGLARAGSDVRVLHLAEVLALALPPGR